MVEGVVQKASLLAHSAVIKVQRRFLPVCLGILCNNKAVDDEIDKYGLRYWSQILLVTKHENTRGLAG